MKKILSIIVIVLAIALGLFLLKNQKGQIPQVSQTEKNKVNQTSKNIVQGIKDLITSNVSIKCVYEMANGSKVTSYLKGKDKIKSIIESNNGKSEAIIINGKMYSWDDKTKQGIVMSIDNLPQGQKNEKTTVEDPEKYIDELEKMKAVCQKENFPESIFQLPTDVKFQNMDKIQEMMQGGNL